ncbi:hypothetical protein FQN52_006186 [Onygenales sp. PD_12]|nr:hypothetical protein FQN52_006186 [Onygenales sp. PD_12]
MGHLPERRDGLRSGGVVDNTNEAPSAQQLFGTIKHDILAAHQEAHFTYEDVDLATGPSLLASLEQAPTIEAVCPRLSFNSYTKTLDIDVMHTFTRDCHQAWLNEEVARMGDSLFITPAERSLLDRSTGTTFRGFQDPYAASENQPDMSIVHHGHYFPSVVIESGWSESFDRLHRDMRLWLVGGAGQVCLVLLFKWTKMPGNYVKGVVESWDSDPTGNERLLQTEIIYPIPNSGSGNQVIRITRGQLFGAMLPTGRKRDDIYGLSVSNLRHKSNISLQRDGYRPA